MDRFKFRIYDLEQKHYLRVIQDETTGAEGFAAFYGKYNNICKPMSFFLCHDIDRWVIEQCTGLKDKNGNLIYEGDILTEFYNPQANYIIKWNEKNAKFGLWYVDHFIIGQISRDGGNLCWLPSEFVITGNIHEQAEQKD